MRSCISWTMRSCSSFCSSSCSSNSPTRAALRSRKALCAARFCALRFVGGVSVAGLRPGFGLGGTTHSLLVMLRTGPGADGESIVAMPIAGAEVLSAAGFVVAAGRIGTFGAIVAELEGAGVVGEAAEAGVDGALGCRWFVGNVVDKDSDTDKVASLFSGIKPL